MKAPSRLVLFDIDGTLIKTGRAGVRGMNAAFARLHGKPDALDGVSPMTTTREAGMSAPVARRAWSIAIGTSIRRSA